MRYMGSKRRIAKEILPIMLKERTANQVWVEPFVGGGNMIEFVDGERIGADANRYVVEALISIRDNIEELPKNNKEISENDYKALRENDNYKHKGYAGISFSWGVQWMSGWSKCKSNVDYVALSYRAAKKQSPKLAGVKLCVCDYTELKIPPKSIIYCDPPYAGVSGYGNKFNHAMFWEWCRKKEGEGHVVFVSEYNAPKDFECIWEKQLTSKIRRKNGEKRIEKLFRLRRTNATK